MNTTPDTGPPPDAVTQILSTAPALTARARGVFTDLATKRREIRQRLIDVGFITPLPDQPGTTDIVCVDGATAIKTLYAGDLIVASAIAIEGRTPSYRVPEQHETLAWTNYDVHESDPGRAASAVMACAELRLLAEQPHEIVLIDGSHQTFVLALASALRSAGPRMTAEIVDVIDRWDVPEALAKVCTDIRIVAAPKSDSTRAFAEIVANEPVSLPEHLRDVLVAGDKVLAAMLLEPGEMTRPSPAPKSWGQLHITHGDLTGRARAAAVALDAAIAPLRDAAAEDSTAGIGLTYLMPPEAMTAVKLEHKRASTVTEVRAAAAAIADDVIAPHIQEPAAQFKADMHAKSAVTVADVLHGELVRSIAEDGDEWARFFAISSRTSTGAS